ncbi:MAG: GAF domain-containing protein [Desmonostoc vinosum HA7617-LM4]|jgi:light-regulated signal transduction histidine kinase (bacteriophytochrome)|nr:GAF domain-containing protein [Desmonostoc vinosum HA7617-LM4]
MTLNTKQDLQVDIHEESILHRITNRIRRSLELEEIITVTTAEVRLLLKTDRVMIYKFHADRSGQVIAESIHENRLPSLLGLNFPAGDIPADARELLIKSRVRSVVNVETQEIGQSYLHDLENGDTLSEEIHYRTVDPCHVKYLTAMGVKSSVVAPIIYQDTLWGLLVSHHSESRQISEYELKAMQMVVDQLSVAIAQSTLLTQARAKAQRQTIINRVATLLHSLPTIAIQPALEAVVADFDGVGGRLCMRNEALSFSNGSIKGLTECLISGGEYVKVYTCGQQPVLPEQNIYPLIEQYNIWQKYYKSSNYDVWAITDIYQTPELRSLQAAIQTTKIRSVLMIPLVYRQQLLGYLSIFRNEIDTEILWAGKFDLDQRQVYPHLSFETWRESKQAQARQWTEEDIELARELSQIFASAIQQHELYQQVQTFNENLEKQVQKRTVELQQVAEQQRILFEVVAKIRESLNLDEIFQTTTQEVCQSLQADRVAVYRFSADWSGEFIAEFVGEGWDKLICSQKKTVWDDTYLRETQGGRYRYNQTFAVDDIYQANHSDCHLAALEQIQTKAYTIAPILIGQQLWGLLAAYQNSAPRHWETSEVRFIAQIANQLGVALQQAQFLNQTKDQTEKLTQALYNLQQTQTQLIQTEKMSSLGQLVAGVAHEINNPVNFIYGNINHVSEYAQDLLDILKLYQQDCPNPSCEIRELAQEIDLEFAIEDLPKTLSSMKIGVDRIRQIVLGLRNFSRLDQAEMKPVNIHEGIDSTLLILQHRFKAKPESPAIELVKEYGDLPLIACYAGQLNQVFMNVLSNAIDAVEDYRESKLEPRNGQIIICTTIGKLKDNTKSVVIRIADNGLGIPEDLKTRICDPFFTTKPVGKGTGLGLSISYQIVVDKHGGIFKCDSQPGLGTEFWIEIPIHQIIHRSELISD